MELRVLLFANLEGNSQFEESETVVFCIFPT